MRPKSCLESAAALHAAGHPPTPGRSGITPPANHDRDSQVSGPQVSSRQKRHRTSRTSNHSSLHRGRKERMGFRAAAKPGPAGQNASGRQSTAAKGASRRTRKAAEGLRSLTLPLASCRYPLRPKANSHFGNGGGNFNKYKNANRPKKTRKPEKVPPRAATQTARTATSAPASRTKLPIHLLMTANHRFLASSLQSTKGEG